MEAKISISAGANDALPRYGLAEAEKMLAEHPPERLSEPRTIGDTATAYWAARGQAIPANVDEEDHSDLVPEPDSHAKIWARYNKLTPAVQAFRGLKLGAK